MNCYKNVGKIQRGILKSGVTTEIWEYQKTNETNEDKQKGSNEE